jgi:hypothetical protein
MNRQLSCASIAAPFVMSWTKPIFENDLMCTVIIETVGCSQGSGHVDQTALGHVSQNSKKSLLKLSVMTISNLRAQQVTFLIHSLLFSLSCFFFYDSSSLTKHAHGNMCVLQYYVYSSKLLYVPCLLYIRTSRTKTIFCLTKCPYSCICYLYLKILLSPLCRIKIYNGVYY